MEPCAPPDPPPPTIGEGLFSARSAQEYLAMFDLDPAELTGRRVLDCAGGAASFTAVCNRSGAEVVAVDPLFGQPAATLGTHARRRGGAR